MKLVLLGPPGSGKGTQAKRLAEVLGVPQVSTGDILREARRAGTEVGKRAAAIMDAGGLVGDDIVNELVRERLGRPDAASGFILDGYPRTTGQAEWLEAYLAESSRSIEATLVLEVPEEHIVDRIVGRRTDRSTGQIYHLKYNPPPPGADLVQREDDREEVVRSRLQAYQRDTEPLIEFYGRRGLVRRADGTGAMDEVTRRLRVALEGK